MNNIYKAYVCFGDMETGGYESYGKTYVDAAIYLARHWNKILGRPKYGTTWKEIGQKPEGMPKDHMYLIDEKENKLLLIDTGDETTFSPEKYLEL